MWKGNLPAGLTRLIMSVNNNIRLSLTDRSRSVGRELKFNQRYGSFFNSARRANSIGFSYKGRVPQSLHPRRDSVRPEDTFIQDDALTHGRLCAGPSRVGVVWVPASGYRNGGSGALAYMAGGGYYWSFAPISQSYARYLYFGSGSVGPLDRSYRSFGFSVRPCREL